MQTIEPNKPDITLSTGRVVRHTRMANGASHADMADGGDMSESEWEDYCGILARRNAVFTDRQRELRKQERAQAMLRDGALQFGRLSGPSLETYARTFAVLAKEASV